MILVAVSIDTEVDHRGDMWVKTSPLRFRSVLEGIPGPLAQIFTAHATRPTYLLTTEVMNDPQSVDVLRTLRDTELGTHVHGEHVPPDARLLDPAGTKSWDYTCCYPEDLERRKLEYITEQFQDRFEKAPQSYRAGRYAASGRTAHILSELGYAVETSVTPGIRWIHEVETNCVLDFRHAPHQPYQPSIDDLARSGEVPIWEVPISILERPEWWNLGVNMYQRLSLRPVQRYPIWLRPSTTSWPWLQWMVRYRLRQTPASHVIVFNIMFHSMEVIEGASPYSPTRQATRRVLKRLDRLLGLFEQLGAQFLTLSELAEELGRRQSADAWLA